MTSWPDPFVVKQFLDQLECDQIVAEMKAVEGSPATIYGRGTSFSKIYKMNPVNPDNPVILSKTAFVLFALRCGILGHCLRTRSGG